MPEWRDFLLAEGGTDRDREVASGIQHKVPPLGAGLQTASSGRQPLDATGPKFTSPGCDVNSLKAGKSFVIAPRSSRNNPYKIGSFQIARLSGCQSEAGGIPPRIHGGVNFAA